MPSDVASLLAANSDLEREAAWRVFVETYSPLLLRAIRALGGDYDLGMDRYAHVLGELRRDDFRRLRTFAGHGRCRFTTWLVVVTRRLCFDLHRAQYGRRPANGESNGNPIRSSRRRLVDLVALQLEEDDLLAEDDPETELRQLQLQAALKGAMESLDPDDRLLLRLRFDDGLPAREVASLVDLPTPFHVYRRVNRALTCLRTHLGHQGIGDPQP